MKQIRTLISLIILQTSFSFSFAQEPKNKIIDKPATSKSYSKICILPFYNYSESSHKYLSTYIPELISKELSIYDGVKIFYSEAIKKRIDSNLVTPEILYDKDEALKFFKKTDSDVGIMGRYIIQGKIIRIDFNIVNVNLGNIENGDSFEGQMDENLLYTIDKFSRSSSEWFVKNVLLKKISNLGTRDKTRSEEYLERIRNTRIGSIFRNNWVFAFVIIFFFYCLSRLTTLLLKKFFPKILVFSDTVIDEDVVRKFRNTIKRLIILIGVKISLILMELTPTLYDIINDIVVALIVALIVYAFIISIETFIRLWGEDVKEKINPRVNRDLMPLFITFIKISIVSIGVIVILSKFNIDVGPFIASIGILGIAIGFAIRDSLADVIGGIFLALDHSIAAGDMVTIDGDTGTVKEVGIRNTKLLTLDNELIVIPNGKLSNKKYTNFVLPDPKLRVVVNFSVAYGTDVDLVERIVLEAVNKIDGVVDYPVPICMFIEMADFSLNFQTKFWISNYDDRLKKKMEATKAIYKALNESKISIPFPTHTVYIQNG